MTESGREEEEGAIKIARMRRNAAATTSAERVVELVEKERVRS